MYFLKKLVWLYAVHPWLILREKGWQLNYEVTKDTVINVQNLSVWRPFPCNAIHYRNSNVFFAFGCCWSWSCMPSWDTQNTAMLKCHQALVTTPLCCWSPLNCTSLLRAPALLRVCPPCRPSCGTGLRQLRQLRHCSCLAAVLSGCWASLQGPLAASFIWPWGKRLPYLCSGGKASLSPAFSLWKHPGKLLSCATSRQLWQVSFTHQGVPRSPSRDKFSSWVAEEPVLEDNNGNGSKNLPLNVRLKSKWDILLSALCSSH